MGVVMTPPPDLIKGVKLTPDQMREYQKLSGALAYQRLNTFVNSPGWDRIPLPIKQRTVKAAVNSSRKIAADRIEAGAINSDNDILRKSILAKQAGLVNGSESVEPSQAANQ
jgi:hypothetical protein